MAGFSRFARFETNDPDELNQYLARTLSRRLEVRSREEFHFLAHIAKLELLRIASIETTPLRVRTTIEGSYALRRVEAGGVDSHIPNDGLLDVPGREYISDLTASAEGLQRVTTIYLPERLVMHEAEGQFDMTPTVPLELVDPLDLDPRGYLGQLIDYSLAELERGSDGVFEKYPILGREFQRGLIGALVANTSTNYSKLFARPRGNAARRHVNLLEEYIDAHLGEPITLGDMARATGLSGRALTQACRRVRGQTPLGMVHIIRVRAAHARLRMPRDNDTVASIAREFLFTNHGRFVRLYREQYGQAPVETLAEGRRM